MYEIFFKRLLDFFLAFWGLVFLFPILAVTALLIRFPVQSRERGPIFYRGERTGRHGVSFSMFKFRSMVTDADKIGPSSTSADDPRLTSMGLFLRRFKLDELPQLLNVLAGDMSFVGPRPEVKKFTDQFNEEEQGILSVRPGITDWASLNCPNEEDVLDACKDQYPDADAAYAAIIRPEKLRLQLKYVRHHNLIIDIKIIFLTVLAVLKKTNADAVSVPAP